MDAESRAPRPTAALWVLTGAAALACALFLALGVWQIERLAWKQALVARVEQRVHAEPVPAPGPADWPTLGRERDEYRPVTVHGEFDHARETLVAATTELGSGYWVLTPLRTSRGFWLLVNRGFVPPGLRSRDARAAGEPRGEQVLSGLLRLSEPGGRLWQHNDPASGRWYSRDVAAIAAAQGVGGGELAPYFVDQAAAAGPSPAAWPRAGLTVLHFSNNHRVYAATWLALAAMAAGAIAYIVLDERRLRRLRRSGQRADRARRPQPERARARLAPTARH
ncbi:MAG: SURF1 family protein [Burkholderiaceae bacterium]